MLNSDDVQLTSEQALMEEIFPTNTIKKNNVTERERDIFKLAHYLFAKFVDLESHDDYLFGPNADQCKQEAFETWTEKAEKLYEYCGDYETAKKVITITASIDFSFAKQIINKL